MKKICILLSVVLIFVVGVQAQDAKRLKVKVQTANVRVEPDMDAPVIMQVPLGTQL